MALASYYKDFFKILLRKNERTQFLKEFEIRKLQNDGIRNFKSDAKKLIVFLIPGTELELGTGRVNGGNISIVSLCEESRRIFKEEKAAVVLCTLPGVHLLWKYTMFQNNTNIYRFDQLKTYFKSIDELIIHVPEFLVNNFMNISEKNKEWVRSINNTQLNVMNQNIRLMPQSNVLELWKPFFNKVTITTAHTRYCNAHYRQLYGVPLHKFSVWISPEKYYFKSYSEKENLMIVSPDDHPMKEAILEQLKKIEGLKLQIIENLTYEEYKKTIARAKWALTFGEGLDGYIIEPVFSGAIGFAVYNEEFFTSDFKEVDTIYSSYEVMLSNIVSDINRLDSETSFAKSQNVQFQLCARYYSQEEYTKNIAAFYKREYTFA